MYGMIVSQGSSPRQQHRQDDLHGHRFCNQPPPWDNSGKYLRVDYADNIMGIMDYAGNIHAVNIMGIMDYAGNIHADNIMCVVEYTVNVKTIMGIMECVVNL